MAKKQSMGPQITRRIVFQAKAPKVMGTGLHEMLALLKSLETQMARTERAALSMFQGGRALSPAGFLSQIKAQAKTNRVSAADLARMFGMTPQNAEAAVQDYLKHMTAAWKRKGVRASDIFRGKSGEFTSAGHAADFMAWESRQRRQAFGSLFKPRPASISPVAVAAGAVKPGKGVSLTVDGSAVRAQLSPASMPIELRVPGEMIRATVVGPVSASGSGAGGRTSPVGRPVFVSPEVSAARAFLGVEEVTAGETSRSTRSYTDKERPVNQAQYKREQRRKRLVGQHLEAMQQFREKRAALDEKLMLSEGADQARVLRQIDRLNQRAEARRQKDLEDIRKLAHKEQKAALSAARAAWRAEEQWRGQFDRGQDAARKRRVRDFDAEEKRREGVRDEQARTLRKAQTLGAMDDLRAAGATERTGRSGHRVLRSGRVVDTRQHIFEEDIGDGRIRRSTFNLEYDRPRGGPPPEPGAPPAGPLRGAKVAVQELDAASKGLLATMAANTLKLATWHVGMLAFYGTLGLAAKGMQVMIETGLDVARLDQVFRGVGGSAHELAMDVMSLAAAEGRGRQEALDSALAWSRAGFDRIRVNEAVRVSLLAANVAQLDAMQTTEFFGSVLKNFNLDVLDLAGALGQLNTISNTAFVQTKDLMAGFEKTAPFARAAGFGFSELAGILGATVESTKQTGAAIGQGLKTIISRLNSPARLDTLEREFGVSPRAADGAMKNQSELLRSLWERWQELTDAQRVSLSVQVAGAHQASRFTAILNSYARAQTLATNAQLDLNSAEEESAKIRATLGSRLQGLGAELSRLVGGSATGSGLEGALAEAVELARNLTAELGRSVEQMNKFKLPTGFSQEDESLLRRKGFNPNISPVFGLQMIRLVNNAFALGGALREMQTPEGQAKLMTGRAGRAGARAGGMLTTAQLLAGAAPGFAGWSEARQEEFLKQISANRALGDAGAFSRQLRAADDPRAMLEDRAASLREQAGGHLAQYRTGMEQARLFLEGELAQVEAGGDEAKIERVKSHLESINNILTETNRQLAQAGAHTGEWEGDMERVATLLETQRAVMSGLMESFSAGGGGFAAQLDQRELGLRAQKKFLENSTASIAAGLIGPDQAAYQAAVDKMEEQVNIGLAAARDPAVRAQAAQRDRDRLAASLARAQGDALATGRTEPARLLNQETQLRARIADLETKTAGGKLQQIERENALVQLLEHRVQLNENLEEQEKARLRVQQDQMEFQRRLAQAGPGELLQTASAESLARRLNANALSTGQFYAQSPEMRERILEARDRLQAEAFARGGRPLEELQRQLADRDAQNRLTREQLAGRNDGVTSEAASLAQSLGTLNGTAGSLNSGLAALTTRVEGVDKSLTGLMARVGIWLRYGQPSGTGAPLVPGVNTE